MIILMLRLSINKKSPEEWIGAVDLASSLWNINSDQNTDTYYNMQDKLSEAIDYCANLIEGVFSKEKFAVLFRVHCSILESI